VVTPDREQLVLPVRGLLVQVADPADDQPRGDRLVLLRRERRVLDFGDLGVGDPGIQLVVPDRAGYRIGVQASSPMAAIAARMLAFMGAVTGNRAPARRIAPVTAAL
jgi:hypothetical protein